MSTNISGSPLRASSDLNVEQTAPPLKTSLFSILSPANRKTAFRNSTNSISLSFSGQYNTSPTGSPVALKKASTTGSPAKQVISFLRDICSKAFKPKHAAFNDLASQLLSKNSGDWRAQITSEMKGMSLESFTSLIADLDTFKLRGFNREVIAHIVTNMASIADTLPSLSAEQKDKIKSLQAHFTPDALTPEDRAKFKPALQFAPSELKTVDTPEEAGKGAVNTVLKVPYTFNGETKVGVFKADPSQLRGAIKIKEALFGTAKASGIPVDKEPHFASRAVASSALDEQLFPGNPISVRTQFATLNGVQGILMEKAEGASPRIAGKEIITIPAEAYEDIIDDKAQPTPRELNLVAASLKLRNVTVESTNPLVLKGEKVNFSNFDPDNPRLIEGLLKLQVKDWITGQVDRHPGNYFISDSGDEVKGIDEDCSFGINAVPDEGEDVRGQKALKGFIPNNSSLMLRLPPAVTIDIKKAVNTLAENKEQLRESLKPYLTEQEIDATLNRLDRMNAHVNSDNCIVVGSAQDLLSPKVQEHTDSNNSYWARERMVYDDTQKGWNHLRKGREV